MRSVLVTGGAGFLGRRLVRALLDGGAEVRVLDIAAANDDGAEERAADWIVGSVTNEAAAARATTGADVVFHLAGVADLWARDAAVFTEVNEAGTRNMIEAAQRAGARRFVFCSSATTLVARDTPVGPSRVDETAVWAPGALLGPYPRSKRAGELLTAAAAQDGLDAVIVNPTEPIGPGDESLTPPTRMMLDFYSGRTPAYIDCMLNFAPIDDLARGLVAAAEKGRAGERYLLGGENTPMRALLEKLAALGGRSPPRVRLPYWAALAVGAVDTHLIAAATGRAPKAPLTGVRLAGRRASFDIGKAARELGWRAGPFEPALASMLDWARGKGLIKP